MEAPEMAERILWRFIGGVSIVIKSKDSCIRLCLASQSVLVLPYRHVCENWVCQSMLISSWIRRSRIGVAPLSLHLPVTMSIRILESLSTMRWVTPFLLANSNPTYMPHISACRESHVPIFWVLPCIHWSFESRSKPPHLARSTNL
jgi:hypothetical protein